MINLIQSFAGGLCFAFGAFVGIGLAGLYTAKRENTLREMGVKVNEEVRDRLGKQVDALTRIAVIMESRDRRAQQPRPASR